GDIHPRQRVQRIGIGRRHVPVRSGRIALLADQLPHGRSRALGLSDVRRDATGLLHRDQRITIDVCVNGGLKRFLPASLLLPLRWGGWASPPRWSNTKAKKPRTLLHPPPF